MRRFRFSPKRCFAIAKKEVRHIFRDVSSLLLIFIMPILMIILFGFAVSGDVSKVPIAVLDLNQLQAEYDEKGRDIEYSDELIDMFDNSEYFDVVYMISSQEEIARLINERKINLAIIIPERYSERFNELEVEDMDRVRVFIDGADPSIARIAAEAASRIIYQYSVNKTDKLMSAMAPHIPFEPSARERGAIYQTVLKNELMQQKHFLIPAIISLIVFSIIVVLTASTIVREKERGTIEQLMITPMTKSEFMIGKLLPYILIGFFDILMILALAEFLFSVSIAGSFLLFVGLGMIFVVCALGLGILISTFSSNQGQAVMLAVLVIIPSLILCGIVAPVSTMPAFIQFLAKLLPLTHFLEITRGIMIKGVGAALLIGEIVSLVIFAVVVMAVSILRFKKSLD